MNNPKRPQWLQFLVVFCVLIMLWGGLAAATSPEQVSNIQSATPAKGVFHPQNPSFGMIIGAIVMLTVIITSVIIRSRERS